MPSGGRGTGHELEVGEADVTERRRRGLRPVGLLAQDLRRLIQRPRPAGLAAARRDHGLVVHAAGMLPAAGAEPTLRVDELLLGGEEELIAGEPLQPHERLDQPAAHPVDLVSVGVRVALQLGQALPCIRDDLLVAALLQHLAQVVVRAPGGALGRGAERDRQEHQYRRDAGRGEDGTAEHRVDHNARPRGPSRR